MKKISSRYTFFYKKAFPILWFGTLGIVLVAMVASRVYERAPEALFGPALMVVIGFVVMKKMIWDMVDEVYDDGDFLVVRSGGKDERIALSNVMNVSASTMTNPPRIVLRLAKPGRFGSEVVFSPVKPMSLNPFVKNAIVEDLIVRVDAARRKDAIRR